MKVENPHATPSAAVSPAGTSPATRPARKSGGADSGDRVQLSGEFDLAAAAVRAAGTPVEIRTDAVAEARGLLERGELGTDLERLANSIIDALTDSHDSHAS